MKEETRVVPLYQLKDIANTLRMVSNLLSAPKRESCLTRNVMRDWNVVVDLIREHEPTIQEAMSYYHKRNQTPPVI